MTSATRSSSWVRGRPRAQFVVQSGQALLEVAPAPFADGELTQPKALRDGGVRLAFGAGQNNLRAADDAVGEGAGVGEGQQLGIVFFAEGEGGEGSAARHERTPVNDDAPYYMTYLWDRTLALQTFLRGWGNIRLAPGQELVPICLKKELRSQKSDSTRPDCKRSLIERQNWLVH